MSPNSDFTPDYELWVGGLPRACGEADMRKLQARLIQAVTSAVQALHDDASSPAECVGTSDGETGAVISRVRLHTGSNSAGLGFGFIWLSRKQDADDLVSKISNAINHGTTKGRPKEITNSGNADGEQKLDSSSPLVAKLRETLTFNGRILEFRFAQGHPDCRPPPREMQVGARSNLLELSATCFVIGRGLLSERELNSLIQKWSRFLAQYRIGLDLRMLVVDSQSDCAISDGQIRAAMIHSSLVCVWNLDQTTRAGSDRNSMTSRILTAVKTSKCDVPDQVLVLDAWASLEKSLTLTEIDSQISLVHLNGLIQISEWCLTPLDTNTSAPNDESMLLYKKLLHVSVRRLIGIHLEKIIKVYVSDCDNTLWGGAVAEEGAENLDLTGANLPSRVEDDASLAKGSCSAFPFRLLQSRLAKLVDSRGKILCLASRNPNTEMVKNVFTRRCLNLCRTTLEESDYDNSESMLLDWKRHIAAAAVDQTAPKSESLLYLADIVLQQNMGSSGGLDESFVFLDDNPCELFEVKNQNPRTKDIIAVQIPSGEGDREGFTRFLQNHWVLDVWPVSGKSVGGTDEDRTRTQKVQENSLRAQFRKNFFRSCTYLGSRAAKETEFLQSLGLKFDIKTIEARGGHLDHVPDSELLRISQLSVRTNQMNSAQLRLCSAGAVRDWILGDNGRRKVVTITVSDRFGDYGMVAHALCETSTETVSTVTVVCMNMSCRVLGRGVEVKLLREVSQLGSKIRIPVIETKRNQLIRSFLEGIRTAPVTGTSTCCVGRKIGDWPQEPLLHFGRKVAQLARVLELDKGDLEREQLGAGSHYDSAASAEVGPRNQDNAPCLEVPERIDWTTILETIARDQHLDRQRSHPKAMRTSPPFGM